jgi:hypothetical protein
MAVKIKFRQFMVNDVGDIERRINEELLGWKITKIVTLTVKQYDGFHMITLVGEVDA